MSSLRVVLCAGLVALTIPALSAAAPGDAAKAYERLSSLVGNWEQVKPTQPDAKTTKVSLALTAGGSALVERWAMPSGRESLSIYAVDGERLVMTHYCPQGNQPRLVLVESAGERYRFEFVDGTNLQDPAGHHEHVAWIEIVSPDTFRRGEIYVANGQQLDGSEVDDVTEFRRVR